MFEKYKIEEEDDGYSTFLQSTEDIEVNKVKNVSQLHQNFESYKSDKIKDIVVYKEISDVCNSLSYGGSNIVNKKLDNLLVEIYGSSDAVDALYRECCR